MAKCNQLTSLPFKGLNTLTDSSWAAKLRWLENVYPHPIFRGEGGDQ